MSGPASPWKRAIFVTSSFLYAISFAITGPVLSFRARSIVQDDDPNGMYYAVLMGSFAASKLPATIVAGTAANQLGHRMTLTLSLLGLGISLLLSGYSKHSFNTLLVCRLLTGVFGVNGALFQSLIPSISCETVVHFTDWSMAWSAAFIASKPIISALDEDFVMCHELGALCATLAAAVMWFGYAYMVDRNFAEEQQTKNRVQGSKTSPPLGETKTVLGWFQLMYHSFICLASDTTIVAHLVCVIFVPRLDYALLAKEKNGSPTTVASIYATGQLAAFFIHSLSIPAWCCRVLGTRLVVVGGSALVAVPVLLMPTSTLTTFEYLGLVYMVLSAIAEPGSRKVIQDRAPPGEMSVWVGWLHSARSLSQLTSTFSGAWLMSQGSKSLCVCIAIFQLIVSLVYYMMTTEIDKSKKKKE